ncbi:SpoIIE family protein phosphatase [Micromonospora sp. NPDC000207]|uniref:SpoIIE family protein phosphatase n=1 Tax=Micromonospora sp. NPDC000207 TaxID=3154246 RepID=UPI0033318B3B
MVAGGDVGEAGRLAALGATRLDSSPDSSFDRFAGLVARVLSAPVALVSLVGVDRQFFPGAVGLAEPWQEHRQTPLSHSFCQRVVTSGEPLVVTDARADERVCDNPAIEDLRVVAYAGMPLTDEAGQILGSLCVIDDSPREWTADELSMLADLAMVCSASLQLRIAATVAQKALLGQHEAQAAAQELAGRLDLALRRSQLLLAASHEFTGTVTMADVIAAAHRLMCGEFQAVHVSLALLEPGGRIQVYGVDDLSGPVLDRFHVDDKTPSADVLRTGRPLFLENPAEQVAAYPYLDAVVEATGWQAVGFVPLRGPGKTLGTLNIGWAQPYPVPVEEQTVIVGVAGYVAQAVQRARHLTDRVQAAATLQQAMLTPLATVEHLHVTARYQPAHSLDQVGGDWYDAVATGDRSLSLVIGDVTGHDLHAAAQMGQLRSMLRGYLVDRHEPPSALLRRLDAANMALDVRSIATAVVAHVTRTHDDVVELSWSNAGHPPPLVIQPDGTVATLHGRDVLLGATLRAHRTTRQTTLRPGATLLLHTDGLLERRDLDHDVVNAQLHAVLSAHATATVDELVDTVLATVPAPDHEDDIALLALRVPE